MAITKVTNRVLADNSVSVAQLSAGAVPNKLGSEVGAFAFRNKVINGDMRIDQRNAGAAYQVPNNTFTYPADRFLLFTLNNNPAQVIFAQRQTNTSPGTPPGGANHNNPEHHYFIRTSVGTAANYTNAPGTIEQYNIQHRIEGLNITGLRWGTPQAKTITISFWVRSNYTGTYLCNFSSQAAAAVPFPSGARIYLSSYTINQANTWEKKTITIPGDTTPSTDKWFFDNTLGVTVGWPLGINNTAFQANGRSLREWYTQSAPTAAIDQSIQSTMMMLHNKPYINGIPPYFDLTGVQLEEGSFATPFEQRPIGTELALCQRYYELVGMFIDSNRLTGSGTYADAVQRNTWFFREIKRTSTPTFTVLTQSANFVPAVGGIVPVNLSNDRWFITQISTPSTPAEISWTMSVDAEL